MGVVVVLAMSCADFTLAQAGASAQPRMSGRTSIATSDSADGTSALENAGRDPAIAGPLGPLPQDWTAALPGTVSYAVESDGRVFVVAGGWLWALRSSDGRTVWGTDVGSGSDGDSTNVVLAVGGGAVVTANRTDRALVAYSQATGRQLWADAAPPWVGRLSGYDNVVVGDDGLVFSTDTGLNTIDAHSLSTGALVWQRPETADSSNDFSKLVVADGHVLTDTNSCADLALDEDTGDIDWQQSGDHCASAVAQVMSADGLFYDAQGRIVDADSGAQIGSFGSAPPSSVEPVTADGWLLLFSGGTVTATGPNGTSSWSFGSASGPDSVIGGPFVAGSTVYLVTADHRLHAVNLTDGSSVAGTVQLPQAYSSRAGMTSALGQLYVPNGNRLSVLAGTSAHVSSPAAPKPIPVGLTGRVPMTSSSNYLINAAHNGMNGPAAFGAHVGRAWTASLPGSMSYPLIADGAIFVTVHSPANYLVAFDPATGRQRWRAPLSADPNEYDFPVEYAGAIYVTETDGAIYAFSAHTGRRLYERQLDTDGGYTWSWDSVPTVSGGVLYVLGSGLGSALQAVNLKDGSTRWVSFTEAGTWGAFAVVTHEVMADAPCTLELVDRSTGRPIATNSLGCDGGGGDDSVAYDGRFYGADSIQDRSVSPTTGRTIASYASTVPPTFAGSLLIEISGGAIHAEDIATHRLVWLVSGDFSLPPVRVGTEVYDVTDSGRLEAFDVRTGRMLYRSPAGHPTTWLGFPPLPPSSIAIADHVLAVPEGTHLVVFRGR